MAAEIVPAAPDDRAWVVRLYERERAWLGIVGSTVWWRYWHPRRPNEHWDVIREVAFVHWRLRRDGVRVIDEIAVDPAARRQGLARLLVAHVGRPVTLKTDEANPESNACYLALGFRQIGTQSSKDGKRRMHVYWLPW